jgi:hypothetical protein
MRDVDLAWAAGLIDGEGCIQIAKRSTKNGHGYVLSFMVNMTHEATILRLRDLFGFGSITPLKTTHKRPQWRWVLGCAQAEILLRMVRPYLVTKAREADIALEYRSHVPRRGAPPPPNFKAIQSDAYLAMREAKHGDMPHAFFRFRPDKRIPRSHATLSSPDSSSR